MRFFTYLVLLLLIVIGLTFAVLNASSVNFNYYLGTKSLPLSVLVISSFLIGALCTLLFNSVAYFKAKMKERGHKKQIKSMSAELEKLRK